jgi:hypothetical protein
VAPPGVAPIPRELLDRRDRLKSEYAELQSDLGGLVYEMAIRDAYRVDVITRRAAKLQAVDAQLTEVERLLATIAQPAPVPVPTAPAPLPVPVAPAAALPPQAPALPTLTPPAAPAAAPAPATCPSCARPLAPGASFCGSCGAPLDSVPPPSPGQAFAGQ